MKWKKQLFFFFFVPTKMSGRVCGVEEWNKHDYNRLKSPLTRRKLVQSSKKSKNETQKKWRKEKGIVERRIQNLKKSKTKTIKKKSKRYITSRRLHTPT